MRVYQREPVIETLQRQGTRLASGLNQVIERHQLSQYVKVIGKPWNRVHVALDQERRSSQAFRSLLLQETIRRGVLAPSLVVSYSHRDEDIDHTIDAFDGALHVYRKALEDGVDEHLVGRPSRVVYRRYNKIEHVSPKAPALTRS